MGRTTQIIQTASHYYRLGATASDESITHVRVPLGAIGNDTVLSATLDTYFKEQAGITSGTMGVGAFTDTSWGVATSATYMAYGESLWSSGVVADSGGGYPITASMSEGTKWTADFITAVKAAYVLSGGAATSITFGLWHYLSYFGAEKFDSGTGSLSVARVFDKSEDTNVSWHGFGSSTYPRTLTVVHVPTGGHSMNSGLWSGGMNKGIN